MAKIETFSYDILWNENPSNWNSDASENVFLIEESNWEKKPHPTRSSDNHHIFNDGKVDIFWKPEDGLNEPFLELLANRLAYSIDGLHVAPTFLAIYNNIVGIGSVSTSTTTLDSTSYEEFIEWEGNSFVARHFVFNLWLANSDWGRKRYDNSYIVEKNFSGDFIYAYAIDFGNTLFCPQGDFKESTIHKLCNNLTFGNDQNNNFFGVEIFMKHIQKAFEAISEIEAKKDSQLYKEALSVARLLGRYIPNRQTYYNQLAIASTKVLIERKRKLRKWIIDLYDTILRINYGR